MSTWPPQDTPCWLVTRCLGVLPVLFRVPAMGGRAVVNLKKGVYRTDPRTGRLFREWSESFVTVPFDDLFGSEEAAEAEFKRRGPQCRQKKCARSVSVPACAAA